MGINQQSSHLHHLVLRLRSWQDRFGESGILWFDGSSAFNNVCILPDPKISLPNIATIP